MEVDLKESRPGQTAESAWWVWRRDTGIQKKNVHSTLLLSFAFSASEHRLSYTPTFSYSPPAGVICWVVNCWVCFSDVITSWASARFFAARPLAA